MHSPIHSTFYQPIHPLQQQLSQQLHHWCELEELLRWHKRPLVAVLHSQTHIIHGNILDCIMIPFLTFWGKRRWATGRGMICVRRWCLASLSLCNDVGYVFLHPWWLLICWCLWHAIELLIALKRKSRQCFQRLYCFRCLVMQRGSAFNGCIAFLASGGSLFSSQCIQQKMTLYIGIGWIGWERWLSQKKKDVTSFFEQHDEASKKDVTSFYFGKVIFPKSTKIA